MPVSQQRHDIPGRLSAPHAVAEHHQCFGFGKVPQFVSLTLAAALVLTSAMPLAAHAGPDAYVGASIGNARLDDNFDGFGIDTEADSWTLGATLAQDALRRMPDRPFIQYQSHRSLLFAGDIDGAAALIPAIEASDMPEQTPCRR